MSPSEPSPELKLGDVVQHSSTSYDEKPQLWTVTELAEQFVTCRTWNSDGHVFLKEKFLRSELVRHDDRPTAIIAFGQAVGFVIKKLRGEGRSNDVLVVKQKAQDFFAAVHQALNDKAF